VSRPINICASDDELLLLVDRPDVDEGDVHRLANGMLKIRIPRREALKPKRIEIRA
jgi:HSP20 family molecular chaperone IbpA